MNELTAIRTEGLSKRYRIGQRSHALGFHELLEDLARAPIRRLLAKKNGDRARQTDSLAAGYIWALDDVSFTVAQGETLAVLGPNGAGKSALLKILARVTNPTRGAAEIRGRVGAMLEVGTGFHPLLTGRENIYLSGALLGMRQTEIRRKFDDIVGFAESEPFLDTPIRRYSSGMRFRLAFAIAAHLEPEILLVDEVLAVSDEAFQARCVEHLRLLSAHGRTILLVSHNLDLVASLCPRALLLDHGRLIADGPTADVIEGYRKASNQ